ncbi:MAG TPA: hypothetical protein VK674_04205 [Candidatus Limnocylindria bacterium]|nr:hypothetical protein [Candidatus Limnocylindria bacterium]
MYQDGLGASGVVAGAVVLPNTGGNSVLMVAAYTSIVVGAAILLTSAVRFVAKRATKA